MKLLVRAAAQHGMVENAIDLLTARYNAAFVEYRSIVDRNAEAFSNGSGASVRSLVEEERAFEALDCARHALLVAAEQAYPTIH